MFTHLPPATEKLWQAYQEAERVRIRAEMLTDLEVFIEALLKEPTHLWHRWAREFAHAVTEGGFDFPVRLPLFRSVLLPALADQVRLGMPGCARWLSHFGMLLHHCDLSILPEQLRSRWGLLAEAIRIDPCDRLARERLVRQQADFIDYTLHELPAGVLYGANGATQSECDELLRTLDEFRLHVAALGQQDKYAELIEDCQYHYTAYRDYHRSGFAAGSYEEFLGQRNTKDGELP